MVREDYRGQRASTGVADAKAWRRSLIELGIVLLSTGIERYDNAGPGLGMRRTRPRLRARWAGDGSSRVNGEPLS